MKNNSFSRVVTVFHGRAMPEPGCVAGYGAIISDMELPLPTPLCLAMISMRFRKYLSPGWKVFSPRYKPDDSIYDHLVFAIKYEGINLLFFKKFFESISSDLVEEWITREPYGIYNRKIWFLYEWLMKKDLNLAFLDKGNYVLLVDPTIQFTLSEPENSPRHRIKNNLPGNVNFCPMVTRTPAIDDHIADNLPGKQIEIMEQYGKDLLYRTSAFLLLKDSKASFSIEGESPTQTRAVRWGKAIGQAGMRPLDPAELLLLQQIIIDDTRFVELGFRKEGGFVGSHDRLSGEPLPDHISSRWQDVELLITGLTDASRRMMEGKIHPVIIAAAISFGFVFIHPFVDGNGRIHRYLMHHVLATNSFTPQGMIFPVSAAILEKIADYRRVLELFSIPLLEWIKWRKTDRNNIEVLNETIDYYRYFDATPQVEFLFDCIRYTLENIIPQEIEYLKKYDSMSSWLNENFQMPERTINLLIRFLDQNNGELSKRAFEKEFSGLTIAEKEAIENNYKSL